MKKFIKNLIGEANIYKLNDIKNRIMPNAAYIEEKGMLEKRKSFFSGFIGSGELCFDVGANVGNRIQPLLDIGAKVVAVEPQKPCYEFLNWKFGNKISVVTKGISDREGVQDFYISDSSVISSFSQEWINSVKEGRMSQYKWEKVERIEMTTLDNLIKQFGKPAFIKVDVEGYELNVLKGLNSPVKMLSFEYTVPEQTDVAVDCIKRIEEIDKNIVCNFSIGESMEYALKEWFSPAEMIKYIESKKFSDTNFGDIYVKNTGI